MKSVLEVTISSFACYGDNKSKPVNLLEWLQSDRYAHKVITIRQMKEKAKRDRIKATLPAVTISGLFDPNRRADHLVQHSKLLCIDIDQKDNPDQEVNALKERLFALPYVAYSGLSVSGQGLFLIIPIATPLQQKGHFYALAFVIAVFMVPQKEQ